MNIRIIKNITGFTLVEAMVVVAIASLLLAVAVPAYTSMIDKQRLTAACDDVFFNLTLARTEAVKNNQKVYVLFKTTDFTFDQDGDGAPEQYDWCYGLYDASVTGCDCSNLSSAAKCTVNGVQTITRFAKDAHVTIADDDVAFSGGSTKARFDPASINTAAGHVLLGSNAWACKVTVSLIGRVRFNTSTTTGKSIVSFVDRATLTN